jgi:hypothetical protein
MNYTNIPIPHVTFQNMRVTHYYLAPENGPTGIMISLVAILIISALWRIISLLRSIVSVDPREREIREIVLEDDEHENEYDEDEEYEQEATNDSENVDFELVNEESSETPTNVQSIEIGFHNNDGEWIPKDYIPLSDDVELDASPPRRSKRLSEKSLGCTFDGSLISSITGNDKVYTRKPHDLHSNL